MNGSGRKQTLAVWKFASCDGCQLSILDCEDELLALAGAVDIAYFLEASSATVEGPYDLSLVEGSITTAHDVERIHEIRQKSRRVVSVGACATAGGVQALRNFADVEDFISLVYASPEYISTLADSTPLERPRAGRLRAAGLPAQQAPAARGDRGLPQRAQAGDPHAQRLHRVQAARQRLRDGGPRHALPGAGHARRLRRALPHLPPRLLRLLRADGVAQHDVARATGSTATAATTRTSCACTALIYAAAPPFQEESEAREHHA